MSDELIRRMEDQHGGLHDAVDATRRELAAWRATPNDATSESLAAALASVSDRLG